MAARLILFDIDGTLLSLGKTSALAIQQTLIELLGPIEKPRFSPSFSGKSDRRILRELLEAVDRPQPDFESFFLRFAARYPELFRQNLGAGPHLPLPGAAELLSRLSGRKRVHLGIVTGNIEATGWLKLEAVGLRSHFPFGAFGCEHEDRDELVRRAIQRAAAHHSSAYPPESVFVIGDSPHDISSARSAGAVAVAVASGVHSYEDLGAEEPDFLLEDLVDSDAVLDILLG